MCGYEAFEEVECRTQERTVLKRNRGACVDVQTGKKRKPSRVTMCDSQCHAQLKIRGKGATGGVIKEDIRSFSGICIKFKLWNHPSSA